MQKVSRDFSPGAKRLEREFDHKSPSSTEVTALHSLCFYTGHASFDILNVPANKTKKPNKIHANRHTKLTFVCIYIGILSVVISISYWFVCHCVFVCIYIGILAPLACFGL
jgi:hypothetical protein